MSRFRIGYAVSSFRNEDAAERADGAGRASRGGSSAWRWAAER